LLASLLLLVLLGTGLTLEQLAPLACFFLGVELAIRLGEESAGAISLLILENSRGFIGSIFISEFCDGVPCVGFEVL
jgi:hypothetical protein